MSTQEIDLGIIHVIRLSRELLVRCVEKGIVTNEVADRLLSEERNQNGTDNK